MIDYSVLALPKGRPVSVLKDERTRRRQSIDERENEKVKARSKGQCEIVFADKQRCRRRALHVHHLLSGIGVRGRGPSALAENKLHVCETDHRHIHGRVLVQHGTTWKRVR